MTTTRWWLCGALWLFAPVALAESAVDPGRLDDALVAYNAIAPRPLPVPAADQLDALAQGETIHFRETQTTNGADARVRVVGMRVVPRPRVLVWLATLNVATQHEPRLLEHRVAVHADHSATWYQHLNAPWPVRDRHWVVRSGKHVAIAEQTQGRAWEHQWHLATDGPDVVARLAADPPAPTLGDRAASRAIYLPANAGAWTMFELDRRHTLVVTHTTADMGCWIPERWVERFVSKQLGDVLGALEAKADRIHEQYDPADPVRDGFGKLIDRKRLLGARIDEEPVTVPGSALH